VAPQPWLYGQAVHRAFVVLAAAGIALVSALGVLMRHLRDRRRRHWQDEHERLSARLEPILAPARESFDGQDLAAEAEQWLGARPDE
jgi:hypothetical protein